MNVATSDAAAAKSAALAFLRAKVIETGMSQSELAKRAGLARPHVSEILAGRLARFGVDRLNRALAVFGDKIETTYLFTPPSP